MQPCRQPAALARRCVTALVTLAALLSLGGAQPSPLAAAARPNIVVFYLDDVSPHDGRLWNSATRTPAIYKTFIAHGLHFTHAYGEDPLCCPSRASILTGLHTHNNGVNLNDARLYVPQESVASELKDAGYSTMWIGKYMNRNTFLSPAGWAAHLAPWTVFDGIYGLNGGEYYDYVLRTKDQGDIQINGVHSTQMIADRAVARLAAAPARQPIFAMLSIYDLHLPNTPMPVDAGKMAKCDNFPPYWTPNYNEADVSDKPDYIQRLALLPNANGWPMETYCREMFGVDSVVERVTDELAAEGRLNNTLLVFTADNGMSWGAHRRGQLKNTPDATALPLYMAWPAGWGTTPRDISEYTSNIDLAPTFCELGGCTLGSYPSGQSQADGRSLVSLVEDGTSLNRDALLEQSPLGDEARNLPGWVSIRTTPQSGLGLWHYTQYVDGERELYNETNDPWELDNLASDPGHNAIQAALAQRLNLLLNEGRINRPDLSIWGKKQKMYRYYAGYNLFASAATPGQTLSLKVVRGTTYLLRVDLRNNKTSVDSFTLSAIVTGGDKVKIQWLIDGADVTSQMNSGGLAMNGLTGAAPRSVTLKVTVKQTFTKAWHTYVDIHAASMTNPKQDDVVTLALHR